MTKRVEEALRNPYVRCLSHPTGRLINRRPENALDLERVFEVALEDGVALEVNGLPARLDLSGEHVRDALRAGVQIVCSTDAHSVRGLGEHGARGRTRRAAAGRRPPTSLNTRPAAIDPRRAPRRSLTRARLALRWGRGRQRCPGARPRRARGADHQPGQGPVLRARGDEARPRPLLRRRRRAAHARDGRPAGAHAALPEGRRRTVVLPEARARQRAGVAADDDRADRQRHALARAGRGGRRARRVGGQPRLPGLPRLAQPRRRPRARRRAAPGPRSAAGHGLRRGPRGRPRAQGAARRARHRRLSQDDRQPRPARLRPAGSRGGTPTPCAPPRWPRRASSSAGAPTSSPPPGGRRSAGAGSSSTTTRTRRTRRSSAPGRCAPARARRSRRRSAGRSSTTSSPTS